jgi:hypothetical protein
VRQPEPHGALHAHRARRRAHLDALDEQHGGRAHGVALEHDVDVAIPEVRRDDVVRRAEPTDPEGAAVVELLEPERRVVADARVPRTEERAARPHRWPDTGVVVAAPQHELVRHVAPAGARSDVVHAGADVDRDPTRQGPLEDHLAPSLAVGAGRRGGAEEHSSQPEHDRPRRVDRKEPTDARRGRADGKGGGPVGRSHGVASRAGERGSSAPTERARTAPSHPLVQSRRAFPWAVVRRRAILRAYVRTQHSRSTPARRPPRRHPTAS